MLGEIGFMLSLTSPTQLEMLYNMQQSAVIKWPNISACGVAQPGPTGVIMFHIIMHLCRD